MATKREMKSMQIWNMYAALNDLTHANITYVDVHAINGLLMTII